MPHRLSDFSPDILSLAIEESFREFWANWGHAPQSDFQDDHGIMRFYTGVPFSFFNGVICNQSSPAIKDEVIEETKSYFKTRKVPWEWVVGPHSGSASLEESLGNHGLISQGIMIGMAAHLQKMEQDILQVENLKIIPVIDDEKLVLWANTVVEGFETPELYPGIVELECSLGCQGQSYLRYLGFLDQKPVATCALILGEKVAGIYCVSTVPTARRMGIGAAITKLALREAHASGYPIAVLQSTSMGRSVYQRLGFQEFSTLRSYGPAAETL